MREAMHAATLPLRPQPNNISRREIHVEPHMAVTYWAARPYLRKPANLARLLGLGVVRNEDKVGHLHTVAAFASVGYPCAKRIKNADERRQKPTPCLHNHLKAKGQPRWIGLIA